MTANLPSEVTRIVLNERPKTNITPTTFRTERVPFTLNLAPKQVLVQVQYLSIDPAMRGYLNDARSYAPPVQIGEPMRANGLGTIVAVGPESTLQVGEIVRGVYGWTNWAVANEKDVTKIVVPPGAELLDFLNTLGSSGLTAYFGVNDVLKLKAGETFVVSGAAGSIGIIASQLGKHIGAKVYAIAGSDDKCQWLEKEIGVEKALNYKSDSFAADFQKIGYVDAYFDNVGGQITDMVLGQLALRARIALCGAISGYNGEAYGLKNYTKIIAQRAKVEGFLVFDYADRFGEAIEEIAAGLANGTIKRRVHIVEGLEQAPSALTMLFGGVNTGKMILKL